MKPRFEKRWLILAGLFLVRTSMGFQYQTVGPLASLLVPDLAIDYARIGALIGLYDLPGIALSLPGALLGKRFGDKRVALAALGFMTLGGLIMSIGASYPQVAFGRLLSGIGGSTLTVLLTKMTVDWFSGREIVVAIASLLSSWPLGISLALMSLGPVATASSWRAGMLLAALFCAFGMALLAVVYHAPPGTPDGTTAARKRLNLSRGTLGLVLLCAFMWGLINVGLSSLLNFTPDFLISVGYSGILAGALVSLITWVMIPSLILGGYLAERLHRPNLMMSACFILIGLGMFLLPVVPAPTLIFIGIGLLFGPLGGLSMAMPARVLSPENRSAGMGIFYTCSTAISAFLPVAAGYSRDITHNPAAPLIFGGALFVLCVANLWLFNFFQRRWAGPVVKSLVEN